MRRAGMVFLSAVVLMWASSASAQSAPGVPDPEAVRIRLGPLWLKPTLALTNAGVDTNIFNVAESEGPEKDFTLTLSPSTDLWLRFGPSWFSGSVREDLIWFKKFSSERAANTSLALGWTLPLSRTTFSAGANWVNTRERPGFEIDARADRDERGLNGAIELRMLSRTLIGARIAHRRINFDDDQDFLGRSLHDELNRTETAETVTLRHELTALTSVTLDVSRQQDRFESSPLRDADSTQTMIGLLFQPDALISGSARLGFRSFSPLAADVPEYRGTTAAVNVAYVARGSTRIGFQANRDVQFSFDVDQPYYLLTGLSTSIAQQVYGPVDVEGRLVRQRLSYRVREGVAVEVVDRVDRVLNYGTGVGYHVGEGLRVAFNVDHQKRSSAVDGRNFSGWRYGTAVTAGF